ncbi:MAG: hypothetical protein QM664_08710 [Flavihumibacter sp.]
MRSIIFLLAFGLLLAGCYKDKSVAATTPPVVYEFPWFFQVGAQTYKGIVDSVIVVQHDSTSVLTIKGIDTVTGGRLTLVVAAPSLAAGTYHGPVASFSYAEDINPRYVSAADTSLFSITLLEMDEARVSGSFSGTVLSVNGTDSTLLLNGSFRGLRE